MVNRDPIVQILFEAAQRGRALRLAREAQKGTPINVKLSQGSTLTGAVADRATQEARRNRREKDTTP